MNKCDIIEKLRMDVEIPEVVQKSADEAFDKIREMKKEEKIKSYPQNQKQTKEKAKFPKKKAAIIIAAATMAFASISAAAAYLHWSDSLSEGMQITNELKQKLEEKHAVAFAMQECKQQGITVTAVQSITDNYCVHIIFKVEGYELEENQEPGFENISVTVDGKYDFNMGASFYNGLVIGADGKVANADGTPLVENSNGSIERYVREDGSMEYWVTLYSNTKGYFIDKQIHIELQNLGTLAKAQYFPGIEGTWSFDWNLQGTDSMKESLLHEPLGDTNAIVTKAELTPISMHIEYEFPKQIIIEEGLNENGETIYTNMYAEPPMIMGVKMKDGTMYPYLANGGGYGYESEDSDLYTATFATDRVIDVDNVESLLFLKSYPENGNSFTEENFYVIPIK